MGPHKTNSYTIVIPEGVNASVQDEHQRSGVNGDIEGVNSTVHRGGERSADRGERQRSYNLPRPTNDLPETPTRARKGGAHAPQNRGTALPIDFAVTEEHRAFCSAQGLPSPDKEIEKFRDYWNALPGARGRKSDWNATFRNWLRKAAEYRGNGHGAKRTVRRDISKTDYSKGCELAAASGVGGF
jgi:hypothetical protein